MDVANIIETEATLTVSHVARRLELSEGQVRVLANRGTLRCTRVGSGIRVFRVSDVEQLRTARAAGHGR
jgi:excisionase family DNA binding protein